MASYGGTTGVAESTTTDFRCVQCGFPVKTLYIQYSPGNIRLVKCGNCKAVADGYIECEIMILILDLILHKPKAYRHVFYNMFNKETVNFESLLWKSAMAYCILDIYKMWVLSTNEKEYLIPASFTSLLLEFGKMLTGVMFGNLVFLCILFCGTRKLLSSATGFYGCKQILFIVIISSYFKMFLLAMMVWGFPSSVIVIIDIFVLSSNTVALKVITNSAMMRCLAVCALAHGMKFFASQNKVFALQSSVFPSIGVGNNRINLPCSRSEGVFALDGL
ncbi:ARV1 family protein [Perilla frutescens var. hirtella]|uniref:Protein ARV n=1 Tax=Perilla frutescens var. hirtella TaxID=608512 RepID=A0AAD4JJR7_PERFH|nr:ARV1 family protein [Perilla frutescens var. hirtella]